MKLAAAAAKKFLAKPEAGVRAALLFGPNRSLVAESCDAVVRALLGPKADDFALTRLQEDEVKRDRALLGDQLAAQSFFGGDRLIRLRADGDSAAEAIVDALKELEAGAPAAAFLLVEGGDLASKSKIRVAFENAKQAVSIAFYDEDEGQLAAFARERLSEAGVRLDQDADELFAAALPPDRALVRGETEKLALYAHGLDRPVNAGEVAALLAVEAESALDEATLAALSGQAGAAVEALEHADAAAISAMRALERRLLRVLEARSIMDKGVSAADAGARLRPPVFWKERDAFAQHLRTWSPDHLNRALDILWRAQLRAMTGGAPQELIAAEAFRAVANVGLRK